MKLLLPWLCVAGLGVGLAALYSSNQKQTADLAKLQAESQTLSATAEESKKTQSQPENDELVQLRKDHDELLRLRNEVHQLRDEKKLLAKQAQAAQTAAANP